MSVDAAILAVAYWIVALLRAVVVGRSSGIAYVGSDFRALDRDFGRRCFVAS